MTEHVIGNHCVEGIRAKGNVLDAKDLELEPAFTRKSIPSAAC